MSAFTKSASDMSSAELTNMSWGVFGAGLIVSVMLASAGLPLLAVGALIAFFGASGTLLVVRNKVRDTERRWREDI